MAASGKTLLILAVVLLCVARCQGSWRKGKDISPLRFTHHLYNATINENSAPRTYIETSVKMGIEVTDLLLDIKYYVVSGDDDDLFQAEAIKVGDFCFLRIKTRSSNSALLNREVRDTYTLTVEATESTFNFQTKTKVFVLVLDTNDLKPLFYPASYNVAIKEDTPLRSSVVRVSATDADVGSNAEFYYSFTSRAHPFVVDPFTGTVSLVKRLNQTRLERYDLTVLAEDRTKKLSGVQKFGNVAKVTVNVQKMSTQSPVITPHPKPSVSADGKITINVHVDTGVKPVESLNIVAGDLHKYFEIIPLGVQGNDFQVISTKRIIWSQTPFGLNLSLQAKDRSSPSLLSPVTHIHIPASHYSPLAFLKDTYIVTLSEFSPPKSHVVKVSVTPVPYNVTFGIKNNPDSSNFRINPKTGIVITTANFDYERKSRYEFDVVANHGEAETHIVVEIIDENDNSPQFTHTSYHATLDENTPVGSSVLKVAATDPDKGKNGFVTYTIANSGPLPFTIDSFTGVISTSEHLDYELMKRLYHLRVWASDSGSPFSQVSECTVTITLNNINDNVPLFERVGCNATVPPDIPVGHTIAELSAIDVDELQQLRYVIEAGNDLQVFGIDSVSGAISLKQPIPLRTGSFTLRVVVSDGKHKSEASIVRITVTNKGDDATIRCQETGIFKQLTDKLIESIKPILVNQEEDTYSDVHITNQHSPKFDLSIPGSIDVAENHPLNSTVLQFKATDNDTGFNSKLVYAITSGNEDGCFSIDTFTGDLGLVCPLDRESKEFYILNITVYDLGTPQTSAWKFIAVNVMDVNDSPPVFDQPRYVIHVPENTEVDSIIFTAHAVDLDADTSGNVQYSLLTSTDMFRIDELTGEVAVTGRLDRETSPRHDLQIEARDQSKLGPQLFSVVELVVVLQDINDNPPKFVPKIYKIKVPEDVPVGTLLLWVESIDLDLGSGGLVTYNLKNTEGGIFHLDSSTGALTLERELDYERRPSYNLTVRAVDHGLPRSLSSSCFVEVQVLDVNENLHRPVFSEFVYKAGMVEDAAIGTSVVILTASDKDLGRDGVVRYHIYEGSGLGVFTIDEETGKVPEDTSPWKDILQISAQDADTNSKLVYSIHSSLHPDSTKFFHLDPKSGVLVMTEELDYEMISVHTLIVMVRDQEIPVKRNFVKVVVYVEDYNDHSPAFLSPRYEASISNLAPTGSEVVRVKALDKDMGSNAEISYSLHSGNIDNIFSIDPELGSISVSKPLDLQPQDQFHLMVKATDQGFPQRSDLCSVHVHIRISDQTPPAFPSDEYVTEISELSTIGTPVVTISASSPAAVHYGIESGNSNGTFYIDPFTGLISTHKQLDFENCSSYKLKVTASTTAGASSKTVVYIYVIDENDNAPVFQQREFIGQISESAHINSMVMGERNTPLVIQASDADKHANSLLLYQILDPEALKVFKIDSSMGTVSLISPVDYEAKAEYHFTVQVKDSGEPALYAAEPAKVTIHVLDLNDCPPQFSTPVFESSIMFPVVRDAEIVRVMAHDADSTVSYSIAEGNLHNTFSIHPTTGVITMTNISEFRPFYELVVRASDGLYKDSATVKVNGTNLTASNLGFEQKVYSASVKENLKTVKTLVALKTTGCYLNEPLSYSVINPMGKFAISQTSGILETTGIPFDREEQDVYDVVVRVEDMRTPPRTATTQVKVFIDDVNDNFPQFLNLPFSMMISDDSEPGDVLYQVTAIDRDLGENGSIMYSLEQDYDLFRIDPDVGDVSLQRPLDFEALNKYVLTVFATDEGEPSHSTVAQLSIQVRNRTNPIFQTLLYPLKVPENVPPFTTILHVQARNPEGYRLIYNLEEENASTHFHVDFKTGVLTVTNPLDYETQTMHVLTVRATDSVTGAFSEASIEVEVEDVNDNAPVFSKPLYNVNIAEGLPVGTSVIQLSASDRDSGRNKDLTFTMVKTEGNETDFFKIDPQSGLIVTKQVLDHEDIKQFNLKIKATDKGSVPLSSEAHVFVNVTDVNDNPPDFVSSQYEATLDEMAKCGHIVIKIQASDPDDGDLNNLRYKILSGNEGRYFNINESSGIISFSNVCKRNLDPYYNLTVAVSDGVFQKAAPVNIDMINSNRHSPYFKQSIYEAELAENAEAGTRVIRLAAIDPDDGPYGSVDYTIINKLADDKFAIDHDGQIVTTQPLDRENPTQRVLAIKVMAKDGGGKVAFCTVKIILTDENDNVPQFQASEYQVSIQSSVNKGSPVIQIMAYDADDGKNADVTYTVDEAEEVTEDIIEINPFTGVVSVKESLVGKENKIFNFKVKARDGSLPFYNTTVPVQVKVVPPEVPLPKFSEPLYSFSAAEDIPIGTEIGSVRADSDMPLIYSLVNGNTVESNKDKVFSLDKESGTLLLQKTIDHEKTKWYQIDVIAQGNHNGTDVASLVSVSIQVQDVNDNQPVFDASPYRAFLAENMPAGTTVIQVTANDPDTDTNGLVTYSLESVPDNNTTDITDVFSIDGTSGWITTIRETDCEVTRVYRFNVVATDHGGEVKLSSSVLVEVTVTDENDNPPKFSDDVYRGSVVEDTGPGEVIISMTTTDADMSLENRLVTCYITDGDPLGQFAIVQEDEGVWGLIVKERLDRETKDRYTLKVTATDGKFEAPVSVDVHVLDINDNSPVCEQLVYTEVVMENSPPSMFVLKVSASDPDVGANGQISYTLHGPNADKFHLDHRTGELFTLAVLDREREVEYNLVAKATDGGGRSCQADVLLMIQDMNDNPPRFSSSHYEVTVFDNTTVRTPIAVIYAKDPDTGINAEVKYSLLGGDSGYFSLDEFSGILRLERPLTSETPPNFELKVKATDRGLPRHLYSVATVTVDVVSLDDYQPVFLKSEYTAQLPESFAVGSEVLSVSALTRDGAGPDTVVYRIVSGNEDERFLLESNTGLLTLIAPLDFEVSREYYLSVEGSRGKSSLSDITTVIINVTDVNDNAPVFGRGDYSNEISEDLTPGALVMKVTATDQDGPINNLLRYSIVSGDPLQQFSIHPRSGEISVRTALDREEVPHYSLTVQAADEGEPPLSSAVLITISVTDVNDNPPVFSQVNHSLLLQEGESVGSSILQLVVTDKDTPKNGPPFSFHIVSGNDDRRFHVDQGGLLSLSAPLRKKVKPQHQLKIQVTDSGHPPLSSICVININVTEQSKYPPSVVPLEVFITTSGGLFANRVIGRLHASDQDLQDVLTYKLVSENPDGGRFSVDLADGKIWADENLDEGSYSLNVSITDGKFSVWTGVKVHVWVADQRALDSGLTLQLDGMSPEEFLGDHWRGLQRSLGQAFGLPRQELHLASLQLQHDAQVLEALYRLLFSDAQLDTKKDSLGLRILRVSHNGCLGTGCPPRGCRNAVRLTGERLSHFTTARAGYITPQHSWESVCPCNESAVRFDGKSYLRYLHRMDEDNGDFKLSLRFKTFQQQSLIMLTNSSNNWGTLQLTNGELQFRYSCGNASPGSLLVRSDPVSNGQWHSVLLEVNSTALRLTLDQQHPALTTLNEPCRMMRSHGALLFASVTHGSAEGLRNFTGCLDNLELNGQPIRVGDTAEWSGPGNRRVFGVYQCCSKAGACDANPCLNSGICEEDGTGEPRCRCAVLYHGARCELVDNPCASEPCSHGRVCVPKAQGYMCNCSLDAACSDIGECSPNPCPGGFDCKVTEGLIHCDPLPQLTPMIGYVEILEICASVLGLLFLVGVFVCIRKHYVQQKKPVCVQDSNGYFHPSLGNHEVRPIEMSSLTGPTNDLDTTPFRSLRPRSQICLSGGGVSSAKTQGPVVCSVAPNLPARPPSSSDNDSIRKNHWDMDYEVYPADPDYYGRPTVQEFPQFDIVEDTYSTSTMDSRRNSRFSGFPFPLDRCDRRAPLPPCYSNQNLDDFLGPDGLPLPSSQCPNEYTAISYYPTQHTRSLDNVSGGYKRLSMRLSVAMPSYAEQAGPLPEQNPAEPQTRPAGQNPRSYDGSSMVESDYGSCEEVMF
uniref:FAT atypical cadherin 2 n=1 Tax=Anabas testudineus TaxID=64144 RepID=A0A7N6ALE1_ANATE